MTETQREYVDSSEMAESAGMKTVSFRVTLTRARKRRVDDRPLPTDIPEPAFYMGRTPVWRRSDMEKWIAAREELQARRSKTSVVEANDEPKT